MHSRISAPAVKYERRRANRASRFLYAVRVFFSRRSCRAHREARSFACVRCVHQNDARDQRMEGSDHVQAWPFRNDGRWFEFGATDFIVAPQPHETLSGPPSRIKHYRGVVLRSLEHIVLMSLSVRLRALRLYVARFQFNAFHCREILPLCCIRSGTLGRCSNEYDYECMRQRS